MCHLTQTILREVKYLAITQYTVVFINCKCIHLVLYEKHVLSAESILYLYVCVFTIQLRKEFLSLLLSNENFGAGVASSV